MKKRNSVNVQELKEKIHEEKIRCRETKMVVEVDKVLDEYLKETKKECKTYGELERKIKELEWKATWGRLGPYARMIVGILEKKIEEEKNGLKIKE